MRAPRFRTLVATPVVALILLVRLAVVGRWRAPTSQQAANEIGAPDLKASLD
jgi:hypothetical protein